MMRYLIPKLEKIIETNEKLPKVLRGKGGFLIEDCGGVWGLSNLIEIYHNKDKKEAEDLGYDEFEYFEEELENTVLKEVDRGRFKLDDGWGE